jgi:hypothetical protein
MLHLGEVRGVLVSNPQGFINQLSGEVLTPDEIKKRIATINKDLPNIEKNIKTAQDKILKYYRCRNWLLLCGFIGLFVSKILPPYLH